jgi:hypothetical protein
MFLMVVSPSVFLDPWFTVRFLKTMVFSKPMPRSVENLLHELNYSSVMFESPFLGEITTEDALEEHSLVISDLISDPEFISLATAEQQLDIQAMIVALLRCAREHEQSWFEKLQRKRIRHLREQAEAAERQAETSIERQEASEGEGHGRTFSQD